VKPPVQLQVPLINYREVKKYPHDEEARTQGLVFFKGELYESTGGKKKDPPLSTLRRVELKTGRPLEKRTVNENYFAEGLTIFQRRVFQLTDSSNLALVYPLQNLRAQPKELVYQGWKRGWGLTHDDRHLILSDSTENIHFVDPNTFEIVRSIRVSDGNMAVARLNELEYVNGYIYANVDPSNLVVRINPQDGRINGQINLTSLNPQDPVYIPNGIAHDPASGHLFVTGKRWPQVFEIKLIDKAIQSAPAVNTSSSAGSSIAANEISLKVLNSKSRGATKMAKTKKTQSKNQAQNGGKGLKQADPPIIVGGGGSVTTTFKNEPTSMTPPDGWRRRFRHPDNIIKVFIHDGKDAANDKTIPVEGRFFVKFLFE
jgi:glutamine cyclotransferase